MQLDGGAGAGSRRTRRGRPLRPSSPYRRGVSRAWRGARLALHALALHRPLRMSPTVSFNFIQLYTEVCVRYRLSLSHDAPKKRNETYGFKVPRRMARSTVALGDTLRPPRAPALFRETADHTRMHTRRHEETVTARRARLSYTARSDVVAREAGRCELLLLMWWHLVHAVPRNVRIRSRFCMRCRFSIDHDT